MLPDSPRYRHALAALLFMLLAGVALARGGLSAAAKAPPDPAIQSPPHLPIDTQIPPLEGGAPAEPPPIAISPRPEPQTGAPGGGPVITIWQGLVQRAGHNGDPQKWFNLLGNASVSPPATLSALAYRLNDGPWRPLNTGPNDRRLALPGDFNIELDYTDLAPGANTVAIEAVDSTGATELVIVDVRYEGGGLDWSPGTYDYEWSSAARIDELAQMVDGPWALDGDSVRPVVFDFDRLLALGDLTWRDYTVTVPITIYGIDPTGYNAPSNGPGIGVMVRWAGHYDAGNGVVPLAGWRRLGALAWYRWSRKAGVYTEGLQLVGHKGQVIGSKARLLAPGTTYFFKLDIQSPSATTGPATYRFKVWPAGGPEPAVWDIVKTGVSGEPTGGSLLLLAHHVDARFGAVRIDLKSVRPPPTLTLATTGSGSVILDPPGPTYRFGEDVVLTAVPAPGAVFAGWTGPLAGASNPASTSLFERILAGATFSGTSAAPAPFYVSPAAAGKTADGVAFAPADILRHDPATGWSLWFDGSDVGLTKNVVAFEILDNGDILLALAAAQSVSGLGVVAPHDVIRFVPAALGPNTAGTFHMELDGSTRGLSGSGEKIDALASTGDGRLAISTPGAAAVGLAGGSVLKAQDEDALAIDPADGDWQAWFDGTAIPGLKGEDVNGLWFDASSGDVYISLLDAFNLGDVRGNGRDIIRLRPAGGGYSAALWWDGSAARFPVNIDGLHITP